MLLVCVSISAAFPRSLEAQQKLRIWLVLNEPALEPHPQDAVKAFDAFTDEWARAGIELQHMRHRAEQQPDFVWSVMGQQNVLARMAEFRKRDSTVPAFEVHFFDWNEYGEAVRTQAEYLRPDLLQVPSTWCSSLAARFRILQPIPEPLASDVMAAEGRTLTRACEVYGNPPLFGLPWLLDVRLLYFWRDDFDSFEKNLQKSDNIRETFWQALQQGKSRRAYPLFELPTSGDWELLHNLALLTWGEGGDLVSTRRVLSWHSSTPGFEEPGLRGLIYIRNLLQQGLISLPEKTRQDLDQVFLEHGVGSVVSGPWLIAQLQKRLNRDGHKWDEFVGVTLPPFYESPAGRVTFWGGSFLSVTGVRPALTETALRLAEFVGREKGSLDWIEKAGMIPAAKLLRGSPAESGSGAVSDGPGLCSTYYDCLRASSAGPDPVRVIDTAIQNGRTYPSIPEWWDLEVPGSLGPVRHLWHDVATMQVEDELRADLQEIAQDWEVTLNSRGRGTSWILGVLILAAVGSLWMLLQLRRRRRGAAIEGIPEGHGEGGDEAVDLHPSGSLGSELRAARGRAGHTQAEAARRTGIAIDALSDIENDKRRPRVKNERIIRAYIRDPQNFVRQQ